MITCSHFDQRLILLAVIVLEFFSVHHLESHEISNRTQSAHNVETMSGFG